MILDHANKLVSFVKSEVLFICGHDLLELSYAVETEYIPPSTIFRGCVRHFYPVKYASIITSLLLDGTATNTAVASSSDVKLQSYCLASAMSMAFDSHALIRTFLVCNLPSPWINESLNARLRERNHLYKHAKRSNSLLGFAIYRHFRDQLTQDLGDARQQYQHGRFGDIMEPARLWRELGNLGLVKTSYSSPLHFFSASQLNAYFASGPVLFQSFATNDISSSGFSFHPIIGENVLRFAASMSSLSHSPGRDGLSEFAIYHLISP